MAETVKEVDEEAYTFVVAVDIGTAYTKLAWIKNLNNPLEQVHHFDKWPGARNRDRVQTAVLYKLNQESKPLDPQSWDFVTFGQDALSRFHSEGHSMALFRSFKMSLHEKENFGKEITIKSSNIPDGCKSEISYPALDIFTSILRELSSIVLQHLKRTYKLQSLHSQEIKWVLTVPALWKATARNFMRQAARLAGLWNESKPRQLALAMEPECAALHVRGLQCEDLLLGEPSTAEKYIVVDVGAGTVDVAVHEVKEHEKSKAQYVHELESCIGNAKGAKTIDDAFEKFMKTLEVKKFPNFFSPVVYYIWDKIMNNFLIAKENYESEDNMRVELPNECFSRYKERVKRGLEDVLNETNSPKAYIVEKSSHYLCIPKAVCSTWYSSTCDNVTSIVRELSKKYDIKVVFIVGGFADCEILWKALKSTDPELGTIIPDNPGLAVVKGAVKYGPIPKAIASRRSHATYGVKTCERYDETKHAGKPKVWNSFHNEYHCHNVFSIFVHKGEEVDPSQPYSSTRVPMHAKQSAITIEVFASNSNCPKYITDDGCRKIGKLHITINPLPASATNKDDNRKVQVTMDFSGPEIFVRITDITDGIKGATDECTLDFLPVENYTVRH